jgi:hypothetical protein
MSWFIKYLIITALVIWFLVLMSCKHIECMDCDEEVCLCTLAPKQGHGSIARFALILFRRMKKLWYWINDQFLDTIAYNKYLLVEYFILLVLTGFIIYSIF